jgi:hypothetical protein
MANLLLRDYEKEDTPRLEKATLMRGLQIRAQVKGIQKSDEPRITGRMVFRSIKQGYKM